jgi:hypothetical protein
VRTGSVPFWTVFNTEPSAAALEHYLDGVTPFDEIFLMLFSHGVESVGLAPIARWQAILRRARRHGDFVGVDTAAYPRDFATFTNYHRAVRRQIGSRYPTPTQRVSQQHTAGSTGLSCQQCSPRSPRSLPRSGWRASIRISPR